MIAPLAHRCCPVLELRQYTLHPGQRDVLIELFDREFVETQEAVGMHIVGQFRDLDRPDRFVWVRGFPDMDSRAAALQAFYGGPVWKAHRDAANATMIDSSDVLLLRPVAADSGFALESLERPGPGSTTVPDSILTVTTLFLKNASVDSFRRLFQEQMLPVLRNVGMEPLAVLETEHAVNTFPALPVRTGENAFVWLARARDGRATPQLPPALRLHLAREPELLRLQATARSRLR